DIKESVRLAKDCSRDVAKPKLSVNNGSGHRSSERADQGFGVEIVEVTGIYIEVVEISDIRV
ncbi:6225_t:CDS:2, partial [Acaulospora colombiana]